MQPAEIPLTPGQRVILETIRKELFPNIEKLKEVLMRIQTCRVSFQIYSKKLQIIEDDYYFASKGFFAVVKKLESPDLLFKDVAGGDANIVHYFEYQKAFKENIATGVGYIEIIDRTLDRKLGILQNTRTLLISVVAILISIFATS